MESWQPGHWKIDPVLGSTGTCVATLVERKSGYLLVGKMHARTTTKLNRATFALLGRYRQAWDQGLLRYLSPLDEKRINLTSDHVCG